MSTSTCLVKMCGTLKKFCPIYCRAIAAAVAGVAPRVRPVSLAKDHMLLSGLEPLKVLPCNSTLFPTVKDDFFLFKTSGPKELILVYLRGFRVRNLEYNRTTIILQNRQNKIKCVLILIFK
jgi:hypothetical protein